MLLYKKIMRLCCFRKKDDNNQLSLEKRIDDLKFNIILELQTYIHSKINEILNNTTLDYLNKVVDNQSNTIKKNINFEIMKELKKLELEIITQITQSLAENIQNKIDKNVNQLEKNLVQIRNSSIEIYKKEFEAKLLESQSVALENFKADSLKISGDILKNIREIRSDIISESLIFSDNFISNSNNSNNSNNTGNVSITNNKISIDTNLIQNLDAKNNTTRYIEKYNEMDDIFWGIGIENETYLEGNPIRLNGNEILNYLGRERYSVDYTKNYNIDEIKKIMKQIYKNDEYYLVSRMINSHSFTKIDINGNNKTTYEKHPKPNIKYNGSSVIEEWFKNDLEIERELNPEVKDKTNIFFDGDTIEFITENFYKINSKDCVNELINRREWFLNKINSFKNQINLWEDLGELKYVEKHPGLNIFRTQQNKIVLFNNSTIHFHITLPTNLENGKIKNESEFLEIHKKAIRLLQWFEPFFICSLGSPDILQFVFQKYYQNEINHTNHNQSFFAMGSMRATVSRYIGIGTYNTNTMKSGKILQTNLEDTCLDSNSKVWWRNLVLQNLLYNLPDNEIGLDFNFNKHYQSGLEFRILDGIPMNILKDVLDIILLICEYSYHLTCNLPEASSNEIWNIITFESMSKGYLSTINEEQMNEFLRIFEIDIEIAVNYNLMPLEDFYFIILEHIFEKVINNNKILSKMTKDFNKVSRWENFNKVQCDNHITSLNSVELIL